MKLRRHTALTAAAVLFTTFCCAALPIQGLSASAFTETETKQPDSVLNAVSAENAKPESTVSANASAAAGSVTLSDDGVLTLSGKLTKEQIWEYRENESVTSIVAAQGTVLPADCSRLFFNGFEYQLYDEHDNEYYITTYYWKNVTSIDLSNADASKVTNMSYMFSAVTAALDDDYPDFSPYKTINISGINISSVTTMERMFWGCKKVTLLNISNIDTSNVTNMEGVFGYCESVTKLDLSGFHTSNVTTMAGMFESCLSLSELDVTGFDTSNVTNMAVMFASGLAGDDYNHKITVLDLSSFNTTRVKNMYEMFRNFQNLETIIVSGLWNTDSVTYADMMFSNCHKLKGGNGTTFNYRNNHLAFARIDQPGQPGYLTASILINQPQDASGCIGDKVQFSVSTESEVQSYQWQYYNKSTKTWEITKLTGNKTATLTVPVTAGRDTMQYRCVITDSTNYEIISSAATLYVIPKIITQPQSVTAKLGTKVKLSVEATGANLIYQWQYYNKAEHKWLNTKLSGNQTNTLTVPATQGRDGMMYWCIVKDAKNGIKVYSGAAMVRVK